MRKKWGKRTAAFVLAAAMCVSDFAGTGIMNSLIEVQAAEAVDATAEYAFDSTSEWDTNDSKENELSLTTAAKPDAGTTLNMNVLIPVPEDGAALNFSGSIKPVGILRVGEGRAWVQSNDIPELKAEDFTEKETIGDTEYYKKNVSIVFGDTVGANEASTGEWNGSMAFDTAVTEAISAVTVQFAGYQCNYSGTIAIADAQLTNTEKVDDSQTELLKWSFDTDTESWYYAAGWEWQYTSAEGAAVSNDNGMLKLPTDFSACADSTWSNYAVAVDNEDGFAVQGATQMKVKVRFDAAALQGAGGSLKLGLYADGGNIDTTAAIDPETATAVEGTDLAEETLVFTFDEVTSALPQVTVKVIGSSTTYAGGLWIDDVTFVSAAQTEDIYVDATKTATTAPETLSITNNVLTSYNAEGEAITNNVAGTIKLVDKDADAGTKAMYAYLQTVGDSDSVLFGHQNDTWHKAGTAELSNSDTTDVTGSISGVVGIDVLSLTGNEFSASRYNSENREVRGDKTFPETAAGNVAAAAALTNENITEGAVITLSAHMPNFTIVNENEAYDEATDPSYAKYDFSGYSPNTLTGDVMNKILPGGECNDIYNAYLDMIADYASKVDGTILFRPFHENTGSWFWWGAAFCDAQTYKNVYKYTVEYLRDTKDIHNLIYVYGPGSEAANTDEYGERYPGDDYVDMIGFDMYHQNPSDTDTWFDSFKTELAVVESFAEAHNKLITVTETGVANATAAGDNQTALLKSGNAHLDWYNEMLDAVAGSKASYFLLWANFGEKDGFYTPYVKTVSEDGTLHGQEELDYFIDFYNDARSVFAVNQKETLAALTSNITVAAEPTTTEATGYITAPVSGKRILTETSLTANITNAAADANVTFVLNGADNAKVTITAVKGEGKAYAATLSAADLAKLGEMGSGSIELYIGEKKADSINAIFNIKEPEADPYEIDGFENYLGVDTLLTKNWATNKATGSTISVSLTKEAGTYSDGNYGLKFTYDEVATGDDSGWAGATIKKEVDWSDCNALQFWTIPDGNNQKVVIQITAGGKEYEAYLNKYTQYASTTKPMLVTIPFTDFVDRDGDGPTGGLTALKGEIQSFGLWVNTIGGSPAIVDGRVAGTIYYDKITAVNSNVTAATFDIAKDEQAALTISGVPASVKYGDAFTLKTTGGSGTGAVSYGVTEGSNYATVDKNGKVTVKGVGKVTITATKAADASYNARSTTVTFTSQKAAQNAIKVTGVSSKLTGGKTATLKVTGGSGTGKVTYKVTSGSKYASVSSKGVVTVKGIGKVTITATKAADSNYNATSATIKFSTKVAAKNTKVTVGKLKYKVTKSSTKSGTVAVYAPTSKKATSVTIPATVKIGGVTFKVTAISKNTFKNCTKLKTIKIKSKNIKSVGSSAFKGISKKAVIKVPSSKLSSYKKLLKGKGQKSSVKIKKY